MKSKSIGILTKPKFPEVKETLHAVVTWLRARSIDVILDTTSATLLGETGGIQKTQLAGKADVLLVLGGDGTMLNAAALPVNEASPFSGSTWADWGFSPKSDWRICIRRWNECLRMILSSMNG
jgi:NAD+ kinase